MSHSPIDAASADARTPTVATVVPNCIPNLWGMSFQVSVLLMALVLVVFAWLLHRPTESDTEKLQLSGMSVPLPEICLAKSLLGVNCPGCGLTRSVVASARGQLGRAVSHHPAGPLIFLIAIVQIPYRLGNIWRLRSDKTPWVIEGGAWLLALISAICIVQWLVNMVW